MANEWGYTFDGISVSMHACSFVHLPKLYIIENVSQYGKMFGLCFSSDQENFGRFSLAKVYLSEHFCD